MIPGGQRAARWGQRARTSACPAAGARKRGCHTASRRPAPPVRAPGSLNSGADAPVRRRMDPGWHFWTMRPRAVGFRFLVGQGARRLLKAGIHLTFPLSWPFNLQSATGHRVGHSGTYGIYDTHRTDFWLRRCAADRRWHFGCRPMGGRKIRSRVRFFDTLALAALSRRAEP